MLENPAQCLILKLGLGEGSEMRHLTSQVGARFVEDVHLDVNRLS